MDLEQHVVTAEIARKLEEIGFNERVTAGWTTSKNLPEYVGMHLDPKIYIGGVIKAPSWLHAIEYLDQNFKVKIELNISPATGKYQYGIRYYNPNNKVVMWEKVFNPVSYYTSYERNIKALLHALTILNDIKQNDTK